MVRKSGEQQTIHHPLLAHVVSRIAEHPQRAVRFRDFMEMCLYHPDHGYYMHDRPKLGKEGDFYTSSAIGTVLGDMLGEQIKRWASDYPQDAELRIVEWGGGDGSLARQVMDRLQKHGESIYERLELVMIEHSPYHCKLQRERLAPHASRVRWIDEQEWRAAAPWQQVFVWANELLDAFPVHRVLMRNGVLYEVWVAWDEVKEQFVEKFFPAEDELIAYADTHGIRLLDGQLSEFNLAASEWIERLAGEIGEGHVTLIDYGDEASEIYAPHRMLGTLMCYRKHLAADDPYVYIGEQDITSHVDFTACRTAAERSGFRDVRVETQAEYLVRGGVLNWLQEHHDPDPFSPAARRNRAIRQLLISDQMSELFKVMTMRKTE